MLTADTASTPSPSTTRWAHVCRGALLGGYAVIVGLRAPEILLEGRFWAEEGTIWFHFAATHPAGEALLAPHLGYYNLVGNLGGVLASRLVPLEFAPLVTVWLGFVMQALPLLLLAMAGGPFLAGRWRLAVACSLLLFAMPSQEVWLTTTCAQFHLSIAAAAVLVSEPRRGWVGRFQSGTLLVAGLTGFVSVFLAPLFWLRAARDRRRLGHALILTACAGIQLFVLVSAPTTRALRFDVAAFLLSGLVRIFALPVFGVDAAESMAGPLRASVRAGAVPLGAASYMLLLSAVFASAIYWSRVATARYLAAAGALVFALTFVGVLVPQTVLISVIGAGRYSFAPSVMFGLALLATLAPGTRLPPVARLAVTLFLATGLVQGIREYPRSRETLEGPPWSAEVRTWRQQPTYPLKIWPAGWRLQLDPAALRRLHSTDGPQPM